MLMLAWLAQPNGCTTQHKSSHVYFDARIDFSNSMFSTVNFTSSRQRTILPAQSASRLSKISPRITSSSPPYKPTAGRS
jgi:hypothetical protein